MENTTEQTGPTRGHERRPRNPRKTKRYASTHITPTTGDDVPENHEQTHTSNHDTEQNGTLNGISNMVQSTSVVSTPSVVDFDRATVRDLYSIPVGDLNIESLIKVLIVKGEEQKNPVVSVGGEKLLKQINRERIRGGARPNRKRPIRARREQPNRQFRPRNPNSMNRMVNTDNHDRESRSD